MFYPLIWKSCIYRGFVTLRGNDNGIGPAIRIILSFFGGPIIGSEGIDAEFASKVLFPFQNIVKTDFVQRVSGHIGQRGMARYSKESQLFITSLPRGSFGIELAKLKSQSLFDEAELADTLTHVVNLIGASAKSDEDFALAIEDTSARTIKHLKSFLEIITKERAGVNIETGGSRCNLSEEDARNALSRVSVISTSESNVTIHGYFRGATLNSWRFDFSTLDGQNISGRISDELDESEIKVYNSEYQDKRCIALLYETKFSFMNGKERYNYILLKITPSE